MMNEAMKLDMADMEKVNGGLILFEDWGDRKIYRVYRESDAKLLYKGESEEEALYYCRRYGASTESQEEPRSIWNA